MQSAILTNRTQRRQVEATHINTTPKIQSEEDPPQARTKHHHKSAINVGMIILQVLNVLRRINSVRLVIDGSILLRNVKLLYFNNHRPCQSNQMLNQNLSKISLRQIITMTKYFEKCFLGGV